MIESDATDELEGQLNKGALWAITYGDLMSFLTVFFLLMAAGISAKSMAVNMSLKSIESQFGKQSRLIEELFSSYGIQKIAKLEVTRNRIKLYFSEPVLFNPGSDTLKEATEDQLRQLAAALRDIPNHVSIEGHTDNQPLGPHSPFKSNWELSAARAFSVLEFFEHAGVPAYRLSATGYGEYRPLKPNTTPANRAANRRIEIDIIRSED